MIGSIRTDLAIEAHKMTAESAGRITKIEGVTAETSSHGHISVTRVEVLNERGSAAIGKPQGHYITIEAPDIKHSTEDYETVCKLLCDEIRKLKGVTKEGVTLVVGLGNRNITPDALGSDALEKLMVTHHMKQQMPELFGEEIGNVCALAPGVLGTTGIESADIIRGVSDKLNPALIIVIDALAAADYNRIGTTFQLCDTGIQPGAGVGNNRGAINRSNMGVPVLAVGVPTVVDARSFSGGQGDGIDPLMVTPKDIDLVIERASRTVANGINLALHEKMSLQEIEEFVG